MMGGRLLVFSLCLLVQCMSLTTTATVVVEPRPTVDVDGYRTSYFGQLFPLNPGGIVPTGPTERDLGLGVDPARGSRAHSDLFHFK